MTVRIPEPDGSGRVATADSTADATSGDAPDTAVSEPATAAPAKAAPARRGRYAGVSDEERAERVRGAGVAAFGTER